MKMCIRCLKRPTEDIPRARLCAYCRRHCSKCGGPKKVQDPSRCRTRRVETCRTFNENLRRSYKGLTVQVMGDHIRITRIDGRDGVSWDELQAAKNEAVGENTCCVEVYPPQHEVVNEANIRHLWVVDVEATPSLLRSSWYRRYDFDLGLQHVPR